MIIVRTPFRISFFGGGTDLPAWSSQNGGSFISASINKHSYMNMRQLHSFCNYNYDLRYYEREEVNKINQIKHNSIRACLDYCKFHKNRVYISHNADLPAQAGLGSSSSFTVGLLKTLYAAKNKLISKRLLADSAINIEQNILNENVGIQDQIAASFGGVNYVEIKNNNYVVQPVTSKDNIEKIEKSCLLFFTQLQRSADPIEKTKIKLIKQDKISNQLFELMNLTKQALPYIYSKNFKIKEFGELLNEQWEIKKKLTTNISNTKIDSIYKKNNEVRCLWWQTSWSRKWRFYFIYLFIRM